jgi:hypothetical protein
MGCNCGGQQRSTATPTQRTQVRREQRAAEADALRNRLGIVSPAPKPAPAQQAP